MCLEQRACFCVQCVFEVRCVLSGLVVPAQHHTLLTDIIVQVRRSSVYTIHSGNHYALLPELSILRVCRNAAEGRHVVVDIASVRKKAGQR